MQSLRVHVRVSPKVGTGLTFLAICSSWICLPVEAASRDSTRSDFRLEVAPASVAAPEVESAPNWAKIIDQSGGSKVQFGTEIEAPPPFDRNQDLPFAPASNAKLFTFTAAIDKLGSDFVYPTVLQWTDAGNGVATGLKLIGYGDPSWGLSELGETIHTRVDLIAKAFHAKGVQQVRGDLTVVAADPRWETLRFPQGWQADDMVSCDGALAQGFNMSINCSTYVLHSPTAGAWSQAGLNEPIQLQVTAGKATRLSVKPADVNHLNLGYIIYGTLKKKAQASFNLPVFNAKLWIKNLLIASLKAQGVTFVATVAGEDVRDTASTQQLTFYSPSLALIGKAMMKNSINMVADGVFKTLGGHFVNSEPDLLTASQKFMQSYLASTGMPGPIVIYDGSGLSREDHVSPRGLVSFLTRAKQLQEFKTLWDSLPIAGVDGTLSNRMKKTAAAGRLRAKTGTLSGVYNLSGYVPSGGDFIPFVMLSNTSVAESAVARGAEDRVGAQMSSTLSAKFVGVELDVMNPEPFPYVPEHAGRDAQ